jgi:hypothetical protein
VDPRRISGVPFDLRDCRRFMNDDVLLLLLLLVL